MIPQSFINCDTKGGNALFKRSLPVVITTMEPRKCKTLVIFVGQIALQTLTDR